MAETVFFVDGPLYSETDQADFNMKFRPQGVLPESTLGTLIVSAPGGLNVQVGPGDLHVRGFIYTNDANKNLSIVSNSSGSTRIDLVIVKMDPAANTCTAQIKQGTPGAGAPALTQIPHGTWEFLLATVTVASGAVSITSGNIADGRTLSVWPSITIDPTLVTGLSTEITNRANADTILTNNLNTEITNRTISDSTEVTNRTNADDAHAILPHVRAWGEFQFNNSNGGITVFNTYNCSLSFQGTSLVLVTFTVSMPNANYIVHSNFTPRTSDVPGTYGISSKTASGFYLSTATGGVANGNQYNVFSVIR